MIKAKVYKNEIRITPLPGRDYPNALHIISKKLESQGTTKHATASIFKGQSTYYLPTGLKGQDIEQVWIEP